jgi:UrcA family protein
MRAIGSIVAAAALLTAVPVLASDAGVKRVAYADLQLESDSGRAELQRRLDRAVASICSVDGVPASAALTAEEARCVTETTASLSGSVDAAIRANRARATATATAARN